MSVFLQQAEFYNLPIHLTDEQKANLPQVLANFFVDYRLSELRDLLSQIDEVCLTTNTWPFCEPEKRADLILYHKKLEILFEATFLIAEQHQTATGKE